MSENGKPRWQRQPAAITHLYCFDCEHMIPIRCWQTHSLKCREKKALYTLRVQELERKVAAGAVQTSARRWP